MEVELSLVACRYVGGLRHAMGTSSLRRLHGGDGAAAAATGAPAELLAKAARAGAAAERAGEVVEALAPGAHATAVVPHSVDDLVEEGAELEEHKEPRERESGLAKTDGQRVDSGMRI